MFIFCYCSGNAKIPLIFSRAMVTYELLLFLFHCVAGNRTLKILRQQKLRKKPQKPTFKIFSAYTNSLKNTEYHLIAPQNNKKN